MRKTEHFQGIQILRGIAASAIVLVHSQFGAAARTSTDVFAWDHMLEAGVDLFFVISGFIMMLVSDPASGREAKAGVFLARRIERIVPLYWFYILLLVAGTLAVPSLLRWTVLTPELVLTSLFFIPAFHPVNGNVQPLISIGWTLQYEMFFYLLFAIGIARGLGVRIVWTGYIFALLVLGAPYAEQQTAFIVFVSNPIVFEFLAGMVLYWLLRRGLVVRRAAIPIAFVILPVLVWSIGSGAAAPLVEGLGPRWHRCLAWGLPAALLVYSMLAFRQIPGPVGRGLERLGDASYSLYLSHLFVVAIVARLWTKAGFEVSPAFGVFVVLPIAIGVAFLSYYVVERPLGRIARRVTTITQKAAARVRARVPALRVGREPPQASQSVPPARER